ncbi:hypothetical protein [Micromonospora sp. KC723]|nr:hypothetical protein [Micromonospora sp. KC723]
MITDAHHLWSARRAGWLDAPTLARLCPDERSAVPDGTAIRTCRLEVGS